MLFVSTSFEWPNVLSVQSLLVPSFHKLSRQQNESFGKIIPATFMQNDTIIEQVIIFS